MKMNQHVETLSNIELVETVGGDWGSISWGFLLGAGFTAGFLGSGGFLVIGGLAGAGTFLGYPF